MFSLTKVSELVMPRLGSTILTAKRLSPELYLAGGLVLGVAAVVTIARAHRKSEEVFEDLAWDLASIDQDCEDIAEEGMEVSIREQIELKTPAYRKAAIKAAKLYGPGVIMGVGSVGLILASHGVMKGRMTNLMSAAAILESGWASYRKRVVDELGPEADERFLFGSEKRTVTILEVDEDGKKSRKKKVEENYLADELPADIYARTFDSRNGNWSPDPQRSLYFLRSVQSHMHDKLQINGYLTLNTVYRALGMSESPYGAVTGWSLNMPGDDYVSLGLDKEVNKGQEGDRANRWIIDPNVNGVMWELIGAKPQQTYGAEFLDS